MSEFKKEKKRLNVRISERTDEELNEICEHNKENRAQVIRRMITETYTRIKCSKFKET